MMRDGDESRAAVADDGLQDNFDAKLVQLFGEIKRIGVLAERGEELRADGDDFSKHA